MSHWPKRKLICLDCRATFSDPGESHTPGHKRVALHDPLDRERLIEQVWGRLQVISSSTPWFERLALVFPYLAAFLAVPLFLLELPDIVVLAVILAVGFGGKRVLEGRSVRVVEGRSRSFPLPGDEPPAALPEGDRLTGTVQPGPTASAPLSHQRVVAFSVILGGSRYNAVRMLTDAATVGFTVVTPAGDLIRIPPGRIEIASQIPEVRGSEADIARYLARLDPLRKGSDDPDPFQHEYGSEAVIHIGDRVAIHNPIERVGFDDNTADYRRAARQVFAVQGAPRVEVLDRPLAAATADPPATGRPGSEDDEPTPRPRAPTGADAADRPDAAEGTDTADTTDAADPPEPPRFLR